MRKFTFVFAAAVIAFAGSASALEVKKSVEVEGKVADVWGKIGGWCAISQWHPAIAKCEEAKNGKAETRTLTTKDGGVIKETKLRQNKTSYSYKIDESPLPVEKYTASLSAASGKKGKVVVTWSARFKEKKGTKADEAKKTIEGIFTAGLDAIKAAK